MATEMSVFGFGVVRDEANADRRRVPVEPYAVLRISVGVSNKIREIRLSDADLARLLLGAADTNATLLRLRADALHTFVPAQPGSRPSCSCGSVMPVGIKTSAFGWHDGHVKHGWT